MGFDLDGELGEWAVILWPPLDWLRPSQAFTPLRASTSSQEKWGSNLNPAEAHFWNKNGVMWI